MSDLYDVLVVDDELSIRSLLTIVLEQEGLRVKTAAGAFEALHCLETHAPPRLILLDLRLGMTHGRTLRTRQQENSRLAHVPVILVSGSHSLMEDADELGAVAWVPKPIDMGHLRDLVRRYCAN